MTKPAEIRALAGARAFPPLVLVMFHFSEGHGYRNFWPLDLLAARGYLWVEFFFCLSGFILAQGWRRFSRVTAMSSSSKRG
jgi:peptidoglycan/LPS O-acetylase OafA/YrhL